MRYDKNRKEIVLSNKEEISKRDKSIKEYSPCTYVNTYMNENLRYGMCMNVHMSSYVHMWKPEINIRHLL